MSENPIVSLDSSSLYIATNQIFALEGKFHWMFYHVDAAGEITTLDWAELPRHGPNDKAEAIRVQKLARATTYSAQNVVTFAFFKVKGFDAPFDTLRELGERAFPENIRTGFSTIKENREANLTCRTFVLDVLGKLKEAGCLQREESPQWFEDEITRVSRAEEQRMAEGAFEESLVMDL